MPGTYQYDVEIKSNVAKLLSDMKQVQDRLDTVEGKEYKIKLNIDEKKLSSVLSNLEKMLDSLGKGTGDFKQFENLSKELSSIVSEVQNLSKAFGKVDDSGAKTLLSSIQNIDRSLSELNQNILNVNKNMSNMGGNTNGAIKQVENITNESKKAATALENVAKAQEKVNRQKTNISSGMKDAFQDSFATASVEKTTQAIKEENSALDETANKAKQAFSELAKGRDIVNQNWYREKGTVIGKDSKGNDITRDADEFSFVERLKNGQLQTVLATYNEETGKWAEQVINVRTAFEQVEKAIISADNKIASLEMAREKTLATHPGYDATADDNQIAIERKKRDELQATLNLYGSEKEYVFEIEAATKRIADNQERLNNKKQSQANLQSAKDNEDIYNKQLKAVREIAAQKKKAQEADRKTEVDIASKNQLTAYKEIQNIRLKMNQTNDTSLLSELERQKKIYQEQYLASTKILRNNSDLYNSEKRLNELKQIGLKTTLKIAENQAKENALQVGATNTANAKSIQAKWEQSEKAIQKYMDAVTKLNNLKVSDKGTGKKSYEIAGQIEEIEKLKQEAYDARQVLSSMINPHEVDAETWQRYINIMNLLDQASEGSVESVNRLKDALKNVVTSELNSLQNSINKYQDIITQAKTYPSDFHPSAEYNTKLANLESAKQALENYKASLQGVTELTKDQQNQINTLTEDCEKAATAFKKLSASEKGTTDLSIGKIIQRINKDLAENTRYSAEAKAGLKALLEQLNSGDPTINTKKILADLIKIENAEIAAGRAGKSLLDIFKTKAVHGFLGQMQSYLSMYVGFYGMVNAAKAIASTVTGLNAKIIDLAKVSEDTSKQIYKDFSSYADIAKDMGGTISDTIEATTNWAKNGYNIPDSKELARVALLYKNVGDGVDISSANESLVSTLRGFRMEAEQAEHIVDVFNEVSNNEAISSSGIGEALQRSAASFNAANTSLEKSVALVTATNSVLQDPDKVGKQILAYLCSNVMKIKVAVSVKILRRTRPRKDYNVCFNY